MLIGYLRMGLYWLVLWMVWFIGLASLGVLCLICFVVFGYCGFVCGVLLALRAACGLVFVDCCGLPIRLFSGCLVTCVCGIVMLGFVGLVWLRLFFRLYIRLVFAGT